MMRNSAITMIELILTSIIFIQDAWINKICIKLPKAKENSNDSQTITTKKVVKNDSEMGNEGGGGKRLMRLMLLLAIC